MDDQAINLLKKDQKYKLFNFKLYFYAKSRFPNKLLALIVDELPEIEIWCVYIEEWSTNYDCEFIK